MPSLQPLNLRVSPDDWNELQKQLNYIIQDIYNYIDTIQGVDNKTFLPQSVTLPDNFSVRFNNTGLQIYDTDGSNVLTVTVNSDLTADRTLTIVTGDASRTITLNGDVTLNDWFDQAVKQVSNVTHASAILSNLTASRLAASDANKKIVSVADLTAWIAGVADEIDVADNLSGGIVLSLPHFAFANDRMYLVNVANSRAISRSSDVITSTVTVANSVAETVIFTGDIDANDIKAGNVIEVRCNGIFSTANAADSVTIRGYIGTTLIGSISNTPGVKTNAHWDYYLVLTARSVGATGSISSHSDMELGDDSNVSIAESNVIDTTTSEDITITVEWDNALAGNTISIFQGFMDWKN